MLASTVESRKVLKGEHTRIQFQQSVTPLEFLTPIIVLIQPPAEPIIVNNRLVARPSGSEAAGNKPIITV